MNPKSSSMIQGKDGTLIVEVDSRICELKSNYSYEFTKVVVNGTLSVNDWNPTTKNGGTLLIKSLNEFIINKTGKIVLNGKGYRGGKDMYSGESYNSPNLQKGYHNLGGGGAGGYCCFAGGAGYGSAGQSNSYSSRRYENGGEIYGDKLLTILHLGSGGGGRNTTAPHIKGGGHGGGALRIVCNKFINNGNIQANGNPPFNKYCGGGSGGSIFIICNEFRMDCTHGCSIQAIGGENSARTGGRGGDGGYGRIRIKTLNNLAHVINCAVSERIKPEPFIDINKILTSGYVRSICKLSIPTDLLNLLAMYCEDIKLIYNKFKKEHPKLQKKLKIKEKIKKKPNHWWK